MKNLKTIVLAICLLAVLTLAFAPMYVVEVPEELVLSIDAVCVFAVTWLLKKIFERFGVDLTGGSAMLAAAVSGLIVSAINLALQAVPISWESVALLLLKAIAIWLGGMGFYRVAKAATSKAD